MLHQIAFLAWSEWMLKINLHTFGSARKRFAKELWWI
jgi:hypothetical protein